MRIQVLLAAAVFSLASGATAQFPVMVDSSPVVQPGCPIQVMLRYQEVEDRYGRLIVGNTGRSRATAIRFGWAVNNLAETGEWSFLPGPTKPVSVKPGEVGWVGPFGFSTEDMRAVQAALELDTMRFALGVVEVYFEDGSVWRTPPDVHGVFEAARSTEEQFATWAPVQKPFADFHKEHVYNGVGPWRLGCPPNDPACVIDEVAAEKGERLTPEQARSLLQSAPAKSSGNTPPSAGQSCPVVNICNPGGWNTVCHAVGLGCHVSHPVPIPSSVST